MNKYNDIALALAGICQPVSLLERLALTGYCDNTLFQYAIAPIFNTNPTTTESVFNGREQIKAGLISLIQVLEANHPQHTEMLRYVFSILVLSKKLLKNTMVLTTLATQIENLKPIYQNESNELSELLLNRLANIYSEIISPLGEKIRIPGKVEILQNPFVQSKIRALLLAGIRSGVLWQQVGGTRFNLIFSRKKILAAAKNLI